MNHVVAFDLDGTLSRSDLFLMPAYHKAEAEMGIGPFPDSKLCEMIGGTAEDNWHLIMPDRTFAEFQHFEKLVVDYSAGSLAERARSFPGMPESLRSLRERGYKLALCSNGSEGYVRRVLGALGLLGLFDYIGGGIPGGVKAQVLGNILRAFAPASAVMVGDRRFDLEAARENGVPSIGCAFGLFPDEARRADAVISAASELPDTVERLIGRPQ